MDSALYNEREIQDAAQKILQTWYDNQESRQEAYRELYTGLYNNGLKLLAGELKQSVTGTVNSKPEHREYLVKVSFILKCRRFKMGSMRFQFN